MKKAVMYGAGNIGRGFIGQLFSMSGYEVVFIDINHVLIEKLNADGCYPIRVVSQEKTTDFIVNNVRGVNAGNLDEVAFEISTADIMATAVGVNILPRISSPIAAGLKKRLECGNFSPLNIIICENLFDADKYLSNLIKQELNEKEISFLDKFIGLVEASIGRMVPVMTSEMQEGNPLRVYVEEYCELPVDRNAFKGEIPEIINLHPFSPFSFYIQRKLFMHNMGHATSAYLGFCKGYKYIWEACKDSTVKLIILKALQESSLAMSYEHNVPIKSLLEHSNDLVYRFSNKLLADTVNRVGKDPVRKLSQNDRLLGAAQLCIKQGVTPVYISIGIAAGLVFYDEADDSSLKLRDHIRQLGIENALNTFCGLTYKDKIYKIVIEFYNLFKTGHSIEVILERAEYLENTFY